MYGFGDENLKFPFILAIIVLMNSLNIMLSRVEHEKSFIISGQGWTPTSISSYRDLVDT